MRASSLLPLLACLPLSLPVFAEIQAVTPPPPARKFTAEAEAAYLRSTGTSTQETFKGFLFTRHLDDDWTYEFRVDGLNESDSETDIRTRERYLFVHKTSWNFTPRDYLFVKPQYEKDLQSPYDYQAMLAAGYGHLFLKTATLHWNVDVGAGNRVSKLEATGDLQDEAVGNVATRFEWQIVPSTRFTEQASLEAGEETQILRTRSAFLVTLTNTLALSLAYETKQEDSVPRIDDTLLTFGLNFQLK